MDEAEAITALRAELAALRTQGGELERALSAMKREAHQLEQIISSVPGVCWVAEGKLGEPSQRMAYVGGQPERILGYSREAWLSTASFALTIMHPEDKAELIRQSAAFRDTSGRPLQYRYLAKDGREVWVEAHIQVIPAASGEGLRKCGVLIDVTERVRAEEARTALLERSEALRHRLDNVIASVPGLVWEVRGLAGTRHEFTFASEHLTTMMGYRVDECVGNPNFWRTIVHPEDAPWVIREVAETYAKGGGTVPYRWVTKDGRTIWVASRIVPIADEGGEIVGAYGITMDITAQKLAEEEQARLREEVIRAQAAAVEALSTPLIPISSDVLVMPLVGGVDRARAERVIEALLQGVSQARARFAIIDITGVPSVDAQTADALLRAARAVLLLGARVVLTGIRPEVAQSLVALGTDLQGVITCANLESGIAYAARR